jgi:hypothetical protein
MIDRKALWISILLVLAMIAANIWWLSRLPDWRHVPIEKMDHSTIIIPFFWTFLAPLVALFMIALIFAFNWKFGPEQTSPKEAVQSWGRLQSLALVFGVGMPALAYAYHIARTLGALQSVDRLTLSHFMLAVTGIFLMAYGNTLPKLPWLSKRSSPLDPWQWNQHRRFQGKLVFFFGLLVVMTAPVLPIKMAAPAGLGLSLAVIATSLWYRAKVKREPLP